MENNGYDYLLQLRATGLLPALLRPIRSGLCFHLPKYYELLDNWEMEILPPNPCLPPLKSLFLNPWDRMSNRSRVLALSRLFWAPYETDMQVRAKLRILSCKYPRRTLGINSAGSKLANTERLDQSFNSCGCVNWVTYRLNFFYLYNLPGHWSFPPRSVMAVQL